MNAADAPGATVTHPFKWTVHFDMRLADVEAGAGIYGAAVEMSSWADTHRCSSIVVSQHHGSDDGYLPSPLAFAGAVAAVTEHTRVSAIVILPLEDPVRVAEDAIVVDLVSGGRLDLTAVVGYVQAEFDMFGIDSCARGRILSEKVGVLATAMSGEKFEYEGRSGHVRPFPVQRPRPPIILGGTVKSAAIRAARLADGFNPTFAATDETIAAYLAECRRLDKVPSVVAGPSPYSVHVSDDPERDWPAVAAGFERDALAYGLWASSADVPTGYTTAAAADHLRRSGQYLCLTPSECVTYIRDHLTLDKSTRGLRMKPLVGGLDPELGFRGLELFANEVLPHLDVVPPEPLGVVKASGAGALTKQGSP